MKGKKSDYIIFILTLAFTTFEYFFREDRLFVILALISIFIAFIKGLYKRYDIALSLFFVCFLTLWSFVQSAFVSSYSVITSISLCVTLCGAMSIAMIVQERFVRIFVTTMYYIAIIAVVLWGLCLIPSIKYFLLDVLTPKFTSLNVEAAVFEGGGKNFIIHNFAAGDYVLDTIGFMRNCGPFWEPGMFAVFLVIALFLHNIVEKQNLRFCNVVLIIGLVTTFSTGGFLSGMIVLIAYSITARKNYFISLLVIVCAIFIWQYLMSLDYIGAKLLDQMANTELGSDVSRFSAFLTQLEMIKDHPILGGARFSDYLNVGNKTLASGFLLPYVRYGIPIGSLYMFIMLVSFIKLVKVKDNKTLGGILLFVQLLVLSFSQTILLSNWMLVMVFVGLINKNIRYYENRI